MTSPSAGARILAVSDEVSPALDTCSIPNHLKNIDFIMSCHNAPLYYVLGNHDAEGFQRSNGQVSYRPDAGDSLEGCIRCVDGILLAGLGGSIRYGSTPKHQYTEAEMWRRVLQLTPYLIRNQARYGRRLDIFVTHSPARGIQEGDDPAHRGFAAFRWLLDYANPRWMLHGHTRFTRPSHDPVSARTGRTEVIYVPPYRLLRWEGGQPE
jgi:Icc-related predicted phosphoesterase